MRFDEASEFCKLKGGKLVEFRDDEEEKIYKEFVISVGYHPFYVWQDIIWNGTET